MIPLLVAIVVLLAASAFFSSAEVAYFSLSPLRTARLRKFRMVDKLLRSREKLLGTIIPANLIVNIAVSSLWTTFLIIASRNWGWNAEQVLSLGAPMMMVILIIFGEIAPKLVAVRMPLALSRIYAPPLVFFSWILTPITWSLNWLARVLFHKRREEERPFPTDQEVKTMIDMAVRYGILRRDEELIMDNLVDLGERTVREVLTPRVEMKALPVDTGYAKALQYARNTQKSRYPVYDGTWDNVVGILYTKDLLLAEAKTPIKEFCREPVFVPDTKALSEMLEELRRSDQHIAIAVDEFGGTAGVVTLEDILEAIFGEIVDEFDSAKPYKKLGKDHYLVDGHIDLAALNQLFSEEFMEAEEEFDRLAELITHELGHIPEKGEKLVYNDMELTVRSLKHMRIHKVEVKRKEGK